MSASSDPADPVQDLLIIPDPLERLAWITERGRRLAPLPEHERVEANRVPGCVSAVWLVDDSTPEACRFRVDAEAPVLRGLVALIAERVEGRPPAEVATAGHDLVRELRLERHLTPTRVNGLRALQDRVRACALFRTA